MSKDGILKEMIDGYAKLNELLAEVGEERMTIPGVAGDWSIKDIIAHISVYEWWTGEFIRKRTWPDLPDHLNLIETDQRNAAFYEENKNKPLDEILTDAKRHHDTFVEAVASLSDEDFAGQTRLGMPEGEGWELTSLIPGASSRHYDHHAETIRAWLKLKS